MHSFQKQIFLYQLAVVAFVAACSTFSIQLELDFALHRACEVHTLSRPIHFQCTKHEIVSSMDSVIDSALIEAEKEHVVTAQKRKGEKPKTNPSRKRLEFDFAKQVSHTAVLYTERC